MAEMIATVRATAPTAEGRGSLPALMSLAGRAAVVTGGGGPGLGQAVARRLASMGAHIAVVDLDEAAAVAVAQDVEARFGVRAVPIAGDLTRPDEAHRVVAEATEAFGAVDILVNSVGGAAGGGVGSFRAQSVDDIRGIVDRNLFTTIYMIKAAADGMVERGRGVIVNVSSQAAVLPWTGSDVYGACKAAINKLTRSLAWELSEHGIRVTAVAPGTISSPRMLAVLEDAENQPEYASGLTNTVARTALGRPCSPDEVADVVAFLASDAASYVQGAVWDVGGGMA